MIKAGKAVRSLVATGIEGLDHVLGGGFTANRLYLIEGSPGSGKTTLALQYLLEGTSRGEQGVYVTLSETKEELEAVAQSHGWSLDQIDICELTASEDSLKPDAQYTMFHPSEVELSETTKTVLAEVEKIKPQRVVFDSLSEMRLLAQSPLRYRRQILALSSFSSGGSVPCSCSMIAHLRSLIFSSRASSMASSCSSNWRPNMERSDDAFA